MLKSKYQDEEYKYNYFFKMVFRYVYGIDKGIDIKEIINV